MKTKGTILWRVMSMVWAAAPLAVGNSILFPAATAEAAGLLSDQSTVIAITSIAHMFSVLVMKITAFVIGYKIAKLGYETLVKGITGEFNFGFSSGKAVSAKLKSASPGTLFVLLGAAIIAWGLFVQKPFESELQQTSTQHHTQQTTESTPAVSADGTPMPGPK